MGILLHKRMCQTACIVAVFAAIGGTATIIAGFINLGTFHASSAEASAGIWCGLLMFVHVMMGLLMMGTRHIYVACIYIFVNVVCLGFNIYGAIVSINHYDDFKTFGEYYNKQNDGLCSLASVTSQCVCTVKSKQVAFKDGYSVSNCLLFSFGEDIWLALLIFIVYNALVAMVGVTIGAGTLLLTCMDPNERKASKQKSMRVM